MVIYPVTQIPTAATLSECGSANGLIPIWSQTCAGGPLNGKQTAGQKEVMIPLLYAILQGDGVAGPGNAENNSSWETRSQQEEKEKMRKDIMGRSEKRWHMRSNFSFSGLDHNFQILERNLEVFKPTTFLSVITIQILTL